MDTLPFSYYDMLIVNTFVEFGDLMYSVGRIEDGIKSGRIVDTGASKVERKRFVFDEHVQAMSGEKRRSHTIREELVKNHPRLPGYVQVPFTGLQSPQRFTQEYDQGSNLGYYQSKKRKKTKVYHPLPMSYTEMLPILIQNYGISAIPAKPRRLPYPKKYDVNAKCENMEELGGTSWRIAHLSKTRFSC